MCNLRPLNPADSLEEITTLLHRAYRALGQAGLNFTAVDQSVEHTAERLDGALAWVAEEDSKLVGIAVAHLDQGTPLYRIPATWILGPLAVEPGSQGRGIASRLHEAILESLRSQGVRQIALDTAEPAKDLIDLYSSWGYRRVGSVQWQGKTYRSALMLRPVELGGIWLRPADREDADAVVSVVHEVYEEYAFTWEADGYHRDLYEVPDSYPDGFWVAGREGEILGCVGLTMHERVPGEPGQAIDRRICATDAELNRLYVKPAGRKGGLGRWLCEAVMAEARFQGATALELWSDKRFVDAHRLYERLGSIVVGERICDDPDEAPEWGLYLPLR